MTLTRATSTLLLSVTLTTGAAAADLGVPPLGPPPLAYGSLWDRHASDLPDGPRPRRRTTGSPDYVGSNYGLGKPPVSGIGPRPDWGRSSTD